MLKHDYSDTSACYKCQYLIPSLILTPKQQRLSTLLIIKCKYYEILMLKLNSFLFSS